MSEIRGSHWRVPRRMPERDPEEVAREADQKARDERIAALKRRRAELEQEVALLALQTEKSQGKDWLLFLPPHAGTPEVIRKSCEHLERIRAQAEAKGARMWLDQDHDFKTKAFVVEQWRVIDGGVWCAGTWLRPELRSAFRGCSIDHSTFCEDRDLMESHWIPPEAGHFADLPLPAKEAATDTQNIVGHAGAVCINSEPAYGSSVIRKFPQYRQNKPNK